MSKRCTKCNKIKQLGEFGKHSYRPDGHNSVCLSCCRSINKHARKTLDPEYLVWQGMRARCLNKNHSAYSRYGGRGIYICERWNVYKVFISDMGRRPTEKHQIERIDNDGDYCPENCIWATPKQQGNNRSNNRMIDYKNKSWTLQEIADSSGIKRSLITKRLNKGWSVEEAIRIKPRKRQIVTYKGHTGYIAEIARIIGVDEKRAQTRFRRGFTLEQVFSKHKFKPINGKAMVKQ